MTSKQWNDLNSVIEGKIVTPVPMGFVVDCPWLPSWYGVSMMDYFSSDDIWFNSNIKAIQTFPEIIFFPGFWSEFGMCTEPSAFGAKCTFADDEFPHAHAVIKVPEDIDFLEQPNPQKDGLLPFILKRLVHNQSRIEQQGHEIKFAVARGPLNIASYLMGATEFMMLLMTDPKRAHKLIRKITNFLTQWISLQRNTIKTIDGIFLLDDMIGFLGEEEFVEFGLPYFKELYCTDVTVKFLHNDAPCDASIKYLPEIGINLFNMAFDTNLNDLKSLTQNKVTMLGNIPPRDVLAQGTTYEVTDATRKLKDSLGDKKHVIYSCGGGMPMGVSNENIEAFINTLK